MGPSDAGDCLTRCLARHPVLGGVLPWLLRSRVGTPIVDRVAAGLLRQARAGGVRALVDELAGAPQADIPRDDVDRQFIAGWAPTPAARDRLARFLTDLGTLDARVRRGLLRTWIRVAGVGYAQRQAQRARDRQTGAAGNYPFDAFIAPFGDCNLRCTGCYSVGQLGAPSAPLAALDYVVRELRRLHVGHLVLVGRGEPFFDRASRELLFGLARRHPDLLLSVYTNGTRVEDADIDRLRTHPNLIPLVSLDGFAGHNDARRGDGVFRSATATLRNMQRAGLFFGFISTVFRANHTEVTSQAFVTAMAELGCRFGVYSLFLTVGEGPHRSMRLSPAERAQYLDRLACLEPASPIPVIDLDGLEAHVGCRAQQGLTVYVDAITGQVAPCIRHPIAAADCNLFDAPRPGRLAEILASSGFAAFRAQPPFRHCPAFEG
jgi:sulfatase maturation enzyme AslB (radical SAM superfamily)